MGGARGGTTGHSALQSASPTGGHFGLLSVMHWMLCPPEIICWILILSVMVHGRAFGRRSGHEGGALRNGISDLTGRVRGLGSSLPTM